MSDKQRKVNEAFNSFKKKICAGDITPEEVSRLIDELCHEVIVSHIATGVYPVFSEQITESYFKSVLCAVLTYNETDNKPLIKITPYSFYKLFLELSSEKNINRQNLLRSPESLNEYSIDLFVRAVLKLYPDSKLAPFIHEEQQRIRFLKEYTVNSNFLALGIIIGILSKFSKDCDTTPEFEDIVGGFAGKCGDTAVNRENGNEGGGYHEK